MSLRTEPVRARSSARVQALLVAAADVVDEVGIEHVTTNLVAERAGCSIGTFYRYFPDRVAILRALALRQASVLHEDCQAELARVAPTGEGLQTVLMAIPQRLIERFRTEPGWSAIGFVHTLDTRMSPAETHLVAPPLRGERAPRQQIARDIAIRFIINEFELPALAQDIEVALLILPTLVDRAFASSREGDPAALSVAREAYASVVETLVAKHRDRREFVHGADQVSSSAVG